MAEPNNFFKQTLDDVAKVHGRFSTFKAWVGMLSMIAVGLILLFVPSHPSNDWDQDFPWTRELGIGMVVLGLLVFVAMRYGEAERGFARQVGQRTRALLLVIVVTVVGGAFVYGFARPIYESIRLSLEGQIASAEIVRAPANAWVDKGAYLLDYDGHQRTWKFDVVRSQGEVMQVAYLPSDPKVMQLAPAGTNLFGLIRANAGMGESIAGALVILFCVIALFFNLWTLLFGPGPEPQPEFLSEP